MNDLGVITPEALAEYARRLETRNYHGRVVLSVHGGKIVQLKEQETSKQDRTLMPQDVRMVISRA